MEAVEEIVTAIKNVPALRFPEFDGGWELKRFGEFTKRVSEPVIVEGQKLYQQIGIKSHGKGIFHKELVDGQTLGNKRVFWVKDNAFIVNIVFAWEQAIAKTTSNELGMIASHRFPMYLPLNNQSDVDYLVYFFLTRKGKFLLELASPGGAGRNKTLGQKEFENLKFLIPNLGEQKKIASFLALVDVKIKQLIKKKEMLQSYKKGIMHQVFSQQLRFKDDIGKDFPEWEEKNFGDILESIPTKKHQIKSSEIKDEGLFKVVDQGQQLISGYSNSSELIFQNLPIIIFGDHTTSLKFIDFEFIVGADGTKVLKSRRDNPKYVYYNLSYNNVKQESYKRHFSMLAM